MQTFRVLQWNMLKEELCHNFNLRSMRPIPVDTLGLQDPRRVRDAFTMLLCQEQAGTGEYSHRTHGWHTLGKLKISINGAMVQSRSLWAAYDLTTFKIDAENVTVLGATKLRLDNIELRTLRGVLLDEIGSDAEIVYNHIAAIHNEYFSWHHRGERILRRIVKFSPDIVVMEEYDVHFGPRSPYPGLDDATFPEAMEANGYRSILFDGLLAQGDGIGIFWRTEAFQFDDEIYGVVPVATDGYSAVDSAQVLNLPYHVEDTTGKPLPKRLSRHFAVLCLTHKATGNKIRVCGVHLTPTSRDDTKGTIRGQELQQTINALSKASGATILVGDFNINLRSKEEEHLFKTVPTYEAHDGKRRFRSTEFVLEDVFGDVNDSDTVATSYTTTRNQMIDYVFHTPKHLEVTSRSELRCPNEPMPNSEEASDHISLEVEFRWRENA